MIELAISDWMGLISVLIPLLAALGMLIGAGKKQDDTQAPIPSKPAEPNWQGRLQRGMAKSRGQFWGRMANLFSRGGLSREVLEEIEEVLYAADLGPATTEQVMEQLRQQVGNESYDLKQLRQLIKEILLSKIAPVQNRLAGNAPLQFNPTIKGTTQVVMVVGINGAGKTTTIGKLATQLRQQGAEVFVGACDTFRAAAVDQLQVWCERAQCQMVRAQDGTDPSGVAYETLQKALAAKADYCLLDTAGRLHTKGHLMEELGKSKRVLSKLEPKAPHQVLLVLDAITGQNALRQAEEFNRALGLTGLILTKCDGSAKAGGAVAIVNKLQVPITHIGVGEGVGDLNLFNAQEYLDAMLC